MTGTKGVSVNYGSSDSIKFLCDIVSPPELMSVRKYFFKHESWSSIHEVETYIGSGYGQPLTSPGETVINCGK